MTPTHLVIFEDSGWQAFAPFSLSRPVFCLTSGMTTLLRRHLRRIKPGRVTLWVRPEFESYCRQRVAPELGVPTLVNVPLDDGPAFLVNSRAAFAKPFAIPSGQGVESEDQKSIISAMVSQSGLGHVDALEPSRRWLSLFKLPAMQLGGKMIQSPVDLIYANETAITEDFLESPEPPAAKPAGPFHLVNELDIRIAAEAILSPGCVLDASKGPIVIGAGATIGINAVVQGPCWIGAGATISPLSVIRPGTSIGEQCKVGGEVSASIFLGCSNKSHEGFLGHSYVGKWVNLGAGTTTSNMKNTYGPITLKRGGQEIPTGRRFLGSLIGDHAKTAILTRLMAGSYIGYCSMLAGSTVSPRFVPSYRFWTDKGMETYDRQKAVEVAQRVFTRRHRVWKDADEQIMNYVAETAPAIEI